MGRVDEDEIGSPIVVYVAAERADGPKPGKVLSSVFRVAIGLTRVDGDVDGLGFLAALVVDEDDIGISVNP